MSAVTVPENKLAELQRKAKLVDELVEVLAEVDEALYGVRAIEIPFMLPTRVREAIAKVKGE